MGTEPRLFVVEKGRFVLVRNAEGREITFNTFGEFLKYSGIDLSGKYYIGYEPEITFFRDSEDPSVTSEMIPYSPYEDIISSVDTLIARKADPYYGLTGDEVKAYNRKIAENLQFQALLKLDENEKRKQLRLPGAISPADEPVLKAYVLSVQGDIDSPSTSTAYNPPLPPGVTPPVYKSVTIEVTRVAGWQGNMGWRAVIKSKTEDFVPTNLALSVHTGANCTGYKYTTGAFQYDAGKDEYFATCPAGQEPGTNAEHFGLLYGAAQLSCFTLPAGQRKIDVYAFN